jgi:hypothetical protein
MQSNEISNERLWEMIAEQNRWLKQEERIEQEKLMDPNAVLAELLTIARGLHDADTDNMDINDVRNIAEHGCLLAEHIHNLDKWLLSGGFMPSRWEKQ